MEFRVLGPLEVRVVGGGAVPLGGAKQRALLAALLLRAGEVVPVARLIDDIWGDSPPPSAAHSLEAYVSRLRQLFNGHGASLVRRGAGYCLDLGDAVLDARVFGELAEQVSVAAAELEHERVSDLADRALALWRGPALADVALASSGRAEAERLEELRLRLLEQRFDAELALGRHEALVGVLQVLVGQNPYRERFVAQLMLALYRSGRHAEALDAYERMRTALLDDLGLQPSTELQQLSGQIVRQDEELRRPATDVRPALRRQELPRKARRLSGLVLSGAVASAVMALTASGSAPQVPTAAPAPTEPALQSPRERVALVLPRDNPDRQLSNELRQRFRLPALSYDLDDEILFAEESDERDVARIRRVIERGGFDLVLIQGDGGFATGLTPLVVQMVETKFVFLDASLGDLSLEGAKNAAAVRFADEQTSQLMGYLSALVPPRRASAKARVDTVSIVSGPPTPHRRRVISGFTSGVEQARASVAVQVGYAQDSVDTTECERIANKQIDAGSDVLFVEAGRCGLGALAVARLRGVWAVGGYDDGVYPAPNVLASTYKDWERALWTAIGGYATDTLVSGEDVVLGLDDNYAVGVDQGNLSSVVSESLWSKVVRRCSELRQRAAAAKT